MTMKMMTMMIVNQRRRRAVVKETQASTSRCHRANDTGPIIAVDQRSGELLKDGRMPMVIKDQETTTNKVR